MTHPVTPQLLIAKWKRADLAERAACQEHFIDLCRMLGHPTPAEADVDAGHWPWVAMDRGGYSNGPR